MTAYIVFSFPPRTSVKEKRGWIASLVVGVLRRIVPAGNPDFEHLYDRVAVWHIETDTSTGEPLREVGLDSEGHVVAIGPWRDNHGFFVDSPVSFNTAEHPHITSEQFEHEWNSFDATNIVSP